MTDQVTYASIHRLLERLDFVWEEQEIHRAIRPPEPKTCIEYRHDKSDATLWLPSMDDRPALAADLMSVGAHLVHPGLMDEDEFAAFLKEHRLATQAT
jgi:hypothetical protein